MFTFLLALDSWPLIVPPGPVKTDKTPPTDRNLPELTICKDKLPLNYWAGHGWWMVNGPQIWGFAANKQSQTKAVAALPGCGRVTCHSH